MVVDRVGGPSAQKSKQSGSSIYDTDKCLVMLDAKLLGKREVGTRNQGTESNAPVEVPWKVPLVSDLSAKENLIVLGKFIERLICLRILRCEGTPEENVFFVVEGKLTAETCYLDT
ncbi:hypothetical protein Ct61P_14349 [Colletotrichum tofieldiae]|nr:hypothetical protein Ct61P_14349 [Colletotrichum tofieldiae]